MRFRLSSGSLVFRLILLGVLLATLGSITRYLVLARVMRTDLLAVVSQQQRSLADSVARDVDYKLLERQRFLAALAAALPPELLTRPQALHAWLDERLRLQPLFDAGMVAIDPAGGVAAGLGEYAGLARAYATDPTLQAARDGRAAVGRPLPATASMPALLPFAAPVQERSGRVAAVLVAGAALDAPQFLDRLRHHRIGATGGFLLISPRDHLFISADNPSLLLGPTPAPGVNRLHDRALQGFRGSDITVNAAGVEELSAIASVPAAGWFVVARIPTAEAFAAMNQTRRFITRYSVLGMLVAAVVIGLLTARMLRPLHQAAIQADQMTAGRRPLAPLPVLRQDEVGRLTHAFNQLIVKLSQSQKELEHLAHHDALTGLYNRSVLADRIAQALHAARRSGHLAALLFIDLDGFKAINDELGHELGDHFLKTTALRLQAVTRASDTLARIGGDEFVLFVPDLLADDALRQGRRQGQRQGAAADAGEDARQGIDAALAALAAKVIEAVSVPILHGARERLLGASVGIAVADGAGSVDALLAVADAAMYEAKRRGRRQFVIAPYAAAVAASDLA